MTRFRTHYESLEVSRTASPEVITAAYRSLGKIYHPDLNRGDEECVRIMGLINAAYAILSDPHKRREYDHWIMRREAALANRSRPISNPPKSALRRTGLRRQQEHVPKKDAEGDWGFAKLVARARTGWGETISLALLGFALVGGITATVTRAPEPSPGLQMEAVEQTAEILKDEDILFGNLVSEEHPTSQPPEVAPQARQPIAR